jgi:hypothetical protein
MADNAVPEHTALMCCKALLGVHATIEQVLLCRIG